MILDTSDQEAKAVIWMAKSTGIPLTELSYDFLLNRFSESKCLQERFLDEEMPKKLRWHTVEELKKKLGESING